MYNLGQYSEILNSSWFVFEEGVGKKRFHLRKELKKWYKREECWSHAHIASAGRSRPFRLSRLNNLISVLEISSVDKHGVRITEFPFSEFWMVSLTLDKIKSFQANIFLKNYLTPWGRYKARKIEAVFFFYLRRKKGQWLIKLILKQFVQTKSKNKNVKINSTVPVT